MSAVADQAEQVTNQNSQDDDNSRLDDMLQKARSVREKHEAGTAETSQPDSQETKQEPTSPDQVVSEGKPEDEQAGSEDAAEQEVFPEELLERASSEAGLSAEMVQGFESPEKLQVWLDRLAVRQVEKVEELMSASNVDDEDDPLAILSPSDKDAKLQSDKGAKPDGQEDAGTKPDDEKEPDYVKDLDPDIVGEETVRVLRGLYDDNRALKQQNQQILAALNKLGQAQHQRRHQNFQQSYQVAVKKLNRPDLFGDKPVHELNGDSPEAGNHKKLLIGIRAIKSARGVKEFNDETVSELTQAALAVQFPEEYEQQVRDQTLGAAERRRKQSIYRGTPSKSKKGGSGDKMQDMLNVARKVRQKHEAKT